MVRAAETAIALAGSVHPAYPLCQTADPDGKAYRLGADGDHGRTRVSNALAKLTGATKMLAEVRSASDAKKIMDIASAAEHYARKAQLGEEAIGHARAIKIDAEALFGQFWKEAPKAKNRPGPGRGKAGIKAAPAFPGSPATLADLGLTQKQASEAVALAEIKKTKPDRFEKIKQGKLTVARAKKEAEAERSKSDLATAQAKITAAARQDLANVCDLRVMSCRELFSSGIRPDAVITDPPYPREFLGAFSELAESCALARVPIVAVMSGQSYLPEVMQRLCASLTYRWTLAYLTPGGQAVQQWQAKVNTAWKPVLLFGEAAEWFGDVATSKTNDNDKRFHGWGQSESGMADLVERLTKPGQLVCDPFLGGGTTAVVSMALGRRFVGCDIDADAMRLAAARVEATRD